MSKATCRVGDQGQGFCLIHGIPYTTTFYEGSGVMSADGVPVVLTGHRGHATCGHDTIAVTGSTYFDVNGVKVHRVGDSGHIIGDAGSTYTAISGSGSSDME